MKTKFKWLFTAGIAILLLLPTGMLFAEIPENSDVTIFDVAVSLAASPTGTDRDAYEEILEYFADAVYESTNGALKLGTIRIYSGGTASGSADVVWASTNGRSGTLAGGIARPNISISLYNNYTASAREAGGYTLGHEWGHYAFRMFDEYLESGAAASTTQSPGGTDDPVPSAIMNNQANAVGGNFGWLNFSIDSLKDATGTVLTNVDFRNTENTGHHRVYQGGAWEILPQTRTSDPAVPFVLNRPDRIHYNALDAVAPTRGADLDGDGEGEMANPSIELPAGQANARSDLNIIWMTDNLVFELVLDRSGSMSEDGGAKINNVIEAAKNWVDAVEAGKTSIGLIAYNENVTVLSSIIPIEDQQDRDDLKAAIDTITPTGTTAIGLAAQAAANDLIANTDQTVNRVVVLLSDGLSNTGVWPTDASVLDLYKNNDIPIYTFAYGSNADEALLKQMANETQGEYTRSSVDLNSITALFNQVRRGIASIPGIAKDSTTLAVGETRDSSFVVDPSVGRIYLTAVYDGDVSNLSLSLIAPDGTVYPADTSSSRGDSTLCSFALDNPISGTWTLHMVSNASQAINVSLDIEAATNNEFAYTLGVDNLTGKSLTYPEPLKLTANLSKGTYPIAGAQIIGTITHPNGTIQTITFTNDGLAPDAAASDGVYSALFTDYSEDGIYNITVEATNPTNSAFYSERGLVFDELIEPQAPSAESPVGVNFQRTTSLQVEVSGVVADDHGNTRATATVIETDNKRHNGILETTSDIDFFKINILDPVGKTIQVRLTDLSSNLKPVLTLYDASGNVLASNTLLSSITYPFLTFTPHNTPYIYASVRHNTSTGKGLYRISAGPALASDKVGLPALFASQYLSLGDRTKVTSRSICAGSGFTGGANQVLSGTLYCGGNGVMDNQSVITGNAVLAGTMELRNGARVAGSMYENTAVSFDTIPVQTVNAGTTAVTVDNDKSQSLNPGAYGSVLVRSRGTLRLKAGVYNLASLELQPDAILALDTSSGNIYINTNGNVKLGDRAKFNQVGNNEIVYYTNTTDKFLVDHDLMMSATILAPNGTVEVSARATIKKGRIAAKNIVMLQDIIFEGKK